MSAALETEIVIAGGGIAGITTALELLDQGRRVTLLERAPRERLGGLANEAFGGMLFGGTGLQRLNGIHDSPELFRDDWYRAAEFGPDDHWPQRWADTYVERCVPDVHDWVRGHGVHYFPIVQWVERGDHHALNSLPRYHVTWGTGLHLTQTLIRALDNHPHRDKLDLRCGHYVEDFLTDYLKEKNKDSLVTAEHTLRRAMKLNPDDKALASLDTKLRRKAAEAKAP